MQYMEQVISDYAVQLPGSTSRWVPTDLLKHIYQREKSFRFRLNRFVKGLTRRHYRIEDDDTVYDLHVGNVGNGFLSWDMTMCLFLQEGKNTQKRKGKAVRKTVPLVKEEQMQAEREEVLSELVEASMALVLLQKDPVQDEDFDCELNENEILEALPQLDVTLLCPVIMDNKEFLFVDDIAKALGLWEDETLSVLSNTCGFGNTGTPSQQAAGVQLEFDEDISKQIAFIDYNKQRTIEGTVVNALLSIQDAASEYESVPEDAFQPHEPLKVDTSVEDCGTIDICNPQTIEHDDDVEEAFSLDRFAARGSGVREQSDGRDTSLLHYLPSISSFIRVIHLDYSEEAQAELIKCKVLSRVLCEEPLNQNANKCILVGREAALYAFTGNYTGHVLSHCATALSQGVSSPRRIAESLGEKAKQSSEAAEHIKNLLKHM